VITPTVTVVGSTNIDLITYAERIPDAGETLVGDRFQMGFGGKGANQAVMARLLGATVQMVNCVGDDEYGRMTLENFRAYGVDTTHVRTVPGSSGVAPIWVEPDGSNRILIVPGANHDMTPGQATEAISEGPAPDVIVGQFEIPQPVTAAGFAAGRERGATTILNPAPASLIDPALLATVDWLIPNEVEFAALTGGSGPADDDALRQVADRLGVRLLVTLGDQGAALVGSAGDVIHFAAPRVRTVDTTGAGDAFVGAFAFGLAAGWTEMQAARLGIAIASDSVTRIGTQTSFPPPGRCTALVADVTYVS